MVVVPRGGERVDREQGSRYLTGGAQTLFER